MITHTDLMMTIAKQHSQELIEEASRHRLAKALRRGRRRLWPDSQRRASAPAISPTAGRLATCELTVGRSR